MKGHLDKKQLEDEYKVDELRELAKSLGLSPDGKKAELVERIAAAEVLIKANDLAVYTIRITKNPKIFLPEYQTALTNDIIHTAKEIFTKAWTANNIRVGDEPRNWLARKKLQQEAARECNNLLALIQMAKPLYHLTSKRVKYWGQKTIEVRQALRDWNAGDTKRYGKLE